MDVLPLFATDKLEFEKIKSLLVREAFTADGKAMLEQRKPSIEKTLVHKRLTEASEWMHLLSSSEVPPFQELDDIHDALAHAVIERAILDGRLLQKILKWLETSRLLRLFFSRQDERAPLLWESATGLTPLKALEREISRAIEDDGTLKPDASPGLSRISRRILSLKESARLILARLLKQAKGADMAVGDEPTLRDGRLVIPIKSEFKRKIKGFIHDTSATGQTVFLEPVEVFEINNEIREMEAAWKREAERILQNLTQQTGAVASQIHNNCKIIANLDAGHAIVRAAQRWNGTIPQCTSGNILSLKACYHPLLLLKHKNIREAQKSVVPMTLEMGPEEKGIIISGPNAGGKSVALKTVGLAFLCTQYGIPIPAEEGAVLPVVKGIYIDMGDEQSIDNDLSTFSSRLSWMKQLLRQVEKGSLVLMDEAGGGTDPDEGTALAESFLELLSEKEVRCLVTTHHGNLKVFAHEKEGWENASMEFDQERLIPTYRFQKGIPGSSYAFEIAERLALPERLTQRARERVGLAKNQMESLLLSLEQTSQERQKALIEIRKEEQSLKQKKDAWEKKLSGIIEERDLIRKRALGEAETLLQDANRKIEEAIRAASEKEKKELQAKRKEVETLSSSVKSKVKRKKIKEIKKRGINREKPVTGSFVRLLDSNTTGELVEVSGKQATVLINGLRVKTKYDNLVVSDTPPYESYTRVTSSFVSGRNSPARPVFSATLSVRGMRGRDALEKTIRFIDEGLLRNMKHLTIVHGKGDGILRKLIHEHLASRKEVKHFETAPVQEGGEGCTYIKL